MKQTNLPSPSPRNGLVTRMADRFGVDPDKMMATLKATAFKQSNNAPEVTNEQMMALLVVADQYTLNPFTKELYAFPDKGGIVPIVSIDGWARIVNQHPHFDGVRFQWDAEEQSMTCIMFRNDRHHPVEVTEYMAECKRGSQPWGSHPRRMLRHKAYIQCARLAFGFAGIYDEDEAQRILEKDITPAPSVEKVRNLIKRDEITEPVVAQVEVPSADEFALELTPPDLGLAEAGVGNE